MKVRKDSGLNSMSSIIRRVELGIKIEFALDAAQ